MMYVELMKTFLLADSGVEFKENFLLADWSELRAVRFISVS